VNEDTVPRAKTFTRLSSNMKLYKFHLFHSLTVTDSSLYSENNFHRLIKHKDKIASIPGCNCSTELEVQVMKELLTAHHHTSGKRTHNL